MAKKVKWRWDMGVYVPFCPYCDEFAYEKDRCAFCGEEYKWVESKHKDTIVTEGDYTIVQTTNNHIQMYKGERLVYHAACTEKQTEDELKGFVKYYEDLTNNLKEYKPHGNTITISKFTYKGADDEKREAD